MFVQVLGNLLDLCMMGTLQDKCHMEHALGSAALAPKTFTECLF